MPIGVFGRLLRRQARLDHAERPIRPFIGPLATAGVAYRLLRPRGRRGHAAIDPQKRLDGRWIHRPGEKVALPDVAPELAEESCLVVLLDPSATVENPSDRPRSRTLRTIAQLARRVDDPVA